MPFILIISLLENHGNGSTRTDKGANAASLTVVIIDRNPAGDRIPSDAEVWAEEAAHIATVTDSSCQTSTGLCDGRASCLRLFSLREFPPFGRQPAENAPSLFLFDRTPCHNQLFAILEVNGGM